MWPRRRRYGFHQAIKAKICNLESISFLLYKLWKIKCAYVTFEIGTIFFMAISFQGRAAATVWRRKGRLREKFPKNLPYNNLNPRNLPQDMNSTCAMHAFCMFVKRYSDWRQLSFSFVNQGNLYLCLYGFVSWKYIIRRTHILKGASYLRDDYFTFKFLEDRKTILQLELLTACSFAKISHLYLEMKGENMAVMHLGRGKLENQFLFFLTLSSCSWESGGVGRVYPTRLFATAAASVAAFPLSPPPPPSASLLQGSLSPLQKKSFSSHVIHAISRRRH